MTSPFTRTVAAAAALLALAACDAPPSGSAAAAEALLVVRSVETGSTSAPHFQQADIHRMDADDTGAQNLTAHPSIYKSLHLSPDGRSIAFDSERSDGSPNHASRVWVMRTDGSGLTMLAEGSAPRWSPDGEWIAYQSPGPQVSVMRADGSGSTVLSIPAAEEEGCSAAGGTGIALIGWVPGGSIAFHRHVCGEGDRFYTVNVDGTGLTRTSENLHRMHWSPGGSRLAVSDGTVLRVMNADGSGERALTDAALRPQLPELKHPHSESAVSPWSPDGERLAFIHVDPAGGESPCTAYVVNADGTGLRSLGAFCKLAGWSPRGDRLAFTVGRNASERDVFVVGADGSGAENVTRSPTDESAAVWIRR